MPLPAWEKEGGSSAVLFPLRQGPGDRWRCKVLNYPKLFLNLTTEELEGTWQTAPRLDPKWLNPASRWIDLDFLFTPQWESLKERVWPTIVKFSWALERVNGTEVHLRANPESHLNDRTKIHVKGLSIDTFLARHVRLWETPFPKEPMPFIYNPNPKRYRPPKKPPQLSALDMILQDDE